MEDNDQVLEIALIAFIPFLVAFVFIIFLFYRQRREIQIRKEKAELQLRALRAQMNPHFIFNCLNSIYNSIQSGKSEQASDYLLKFSHLLRRVLENSERPTITLHEDIEMLETYLQLEQYRTDASFEYKLTKESILSPDEIDVPMLLIQPLIENAIWHGMKPGTKGMIDITIIEKDNLLTYQVTNTTEEVYEKSRTRPGHKSMGLSLVKDRLMQLQTMNGIETGFNSYTDEHGRHKVVVTIPIVSIV